MGMVVHCAWLMKSYFKGEYDEKEINPNEFFKLSIVYESTHKVSIFVVHMPEKTGQNYRLTDIWHE